MDTEIKTEVPGASWMEFGDKPKPKKINTSEEYEMRLRKRLARARRR
jgi:hypothetical protein